MSGVCSGTHLIESDVADFAVIGNDISVTSGSVVVKAAALVMLETHDEAINVNDYEKGG